jgi:hypothetical protein
MVVLGLVPGILVIGGSGAHAAYAVDTPIIVDIENFNGGCLTEVTGTPRIENCDDTFLSQDWKLVNIPGDPSTDKLIRSVTNGDCLAPTNTGSGAQVVLNTCDFSGGHSQTWRAENGTVGAPFVQWSNGGRTDLVMHPSGCSTAPGNLIFMNERGQCNADNWANPEE